jgi:hypothetical protein
MISLIERNLGKKMSREVTPPAFVSTRADEEVSGAKRQNVSRQTPRGSKPAAATRGKSRRSKACSFDFGTSKPGQR